MMKGRTDYARFSDYLKEGLEGGKHRGRVQDFW
jgi:hypothetical protein